MAPSETKHPPHLERARALVPLLERCAEAGEAERRLTPALLDGLHDAALFRLLLPRMLDGGEVDPVTFVAVVEEIAKGDGSAAWCLCQAGGCAMTAAYLSPEVARDVFADRRAVLAWGPGPDARAVGVDGGYRVTGTWSFASGCRHATWLGGHCPIVTADGAPRRRGDGRREERTMLFPAASAELVDVWHVSGLRGTGSDAFTVTDLFVPHAYSVSRDDPAERRHPGPLYCFPAGSLYASGFAGVALGLARAMLDAFVELAREKTPRGGHRTLRDNHVVQSQVAQAEARLRSARMFLLGSLGEIWGEVGRSGTLTMEQRMTIRLAATYAIHQARDVADAAYAAAGSSAIFTAGAFERRFRDIHAVTQQLQGRQSHFETVGQFLLGLDPDTQFV
ncbi:MAG TPA: acyl-CoA dehydrogenase family protein [Methylomirabilota bacterium]|nr:acyl-CoA dehydrogenase family protein [Methylomirabilota bacterium]